MEVTTKRQTRGNSIWAMDQGEEIRTDEQRELSIGKHVCLFSIRINPFRLYYTFTQTSLMRRLTSDEAWTWTMQQQQQQQRNQRPAAFNAPRKDLDVCSRTNKSSISGHVSDVKYWRRYHPRTRRSSADSCALTSSPNPYRTASSSPNPTTL